MIPLKTVETPGVDVGSQQVVAAIGAFDGVHLGHRQLFETALEIKNRTSLPVMAVTFTPHPKSLVKSNNGYQTLITPPDEKKALLEDMGVDYFWAMPFTRDVSRVRPREFIRTYLRTLIKAQYIVCGFNFAFGHQRQGTPELLKQIGQEMGFEVSVVPPYTVEGEVVSSTRIRRLLSEGDMEGASKLLGRPYCIYGHIVRGYGAGRQMGMPTSNVCFPADKFLPKNGVYAVWIRGCGDEPVPAVANLGVKPTFGGSRIGLEVHIPGFNGQLYGGSMQVFFVKYIREERRFESRELLKEQVDMDVQTALSVLGAHGMEFPGKGLFTRIGAYDRIFYANIP